jgi:H+-transporting ATPase
MLQDIVQNAEDLQSEDLTDFLSLLETGPEGLAAAEAARRLDQFGPNELRDDTAPLWRRLASYFWGPIPWMIEIAAVLSLIAGHTTEFLVVVILLLGNVAVGFWQEYQAGNVVAALSDRLAPSARARRDGAWTTLPARELVPGDAVRLRLGDVVPADVRLIASDALEVDQSSLTGESLPVRKGEGDTVYSGSVVRRGETEGVVYATGEHTYFGRTADLASGARAASHLQRAVVKIADYLIALDVLLVAIIIIVALFRSDPLLETLQFALILTVAAIPVAMPTVLAVTLAVGARILAARQSIVKRLAAIEELAGIDILCSDKTGTLTQNRLTLGDPFVVGGHEREEVLQAAALASRREDQDPIDLAVLADSPDTSTFRILRFVPFDPTSKRSEAEVQAPDGASYRVAKGAPQVILALVADAESVREEVELQTEDFARRGYRSLGVARTNDAGSWTYLGILPLADPPRADSADTIAAARELGVGVKMVTGDQQAIAKETARRIGLGAQILDAHTFDARLAKDTSAFDRSVEQADGFAQVFPEHKYQIVEALERRDHLVGMTGDGVNDAPALKRAHVGIAVSGATDAARAAADVVLVTPGLSVIVDAIRLSRRIFERMNSYAIYRISETIRVLFFMALTILAFDYYPVTAVMIVLLALLNDGAILSIAYDRVREDPLPTRWRMSTVLGVATSLGLMGVVETFGLFYLAKRVMDLNPDTLRTLIFLKLAVAGHLTYFVARTRGPFWSLRPATIVLAAVLGTQTVSTLISVYGVFMAPIGWTLAALVWGYCLVWFFIEDGVKRFALRMFDHEHPGLLSLPAHRRVAVPGQSPAANPHSAGGARSAGTGSPEVHSTSIRALPGGHGSE